MSQPRYDILGGTQLSGDQVRDLLGAWQEIVGYQRSGRPTRHQHGMYGGHPRRHHRGGYGYGGYVGEELYEEPAHVLAPRPRDVIGPRNELRDRRPPDRADRIMLPMSSTGLVLDSAVITARPQNVAYRPERIIISGNGGDWLVNDIKVGNRSQFSQAGDLPGEAFANNAVDTFVSMETVQTAMDFVMQVTYLGNQESGIFFRAAVFGTAAIS